MFGWWIFVLVRLYTLIFFLSKHYYTFRTPLHSRPPAYLIRICLSKNLCKSGKNVSGLEHLKPVTTGLEHLKPVITRLENPKPVLTGLEHLNQL